MISSVQPLELHGQLRQVIDLCREVRSEAREVQELTKRVAELAVPVGYWEAIARAQATGGFVVPLEGEDRDLVVAYASKHKISVESACCRIFASGYRQLVEADK